MFNSFFRTSHVSWTELFFVCAVLAGIFLVLKYLHWILSNVSFNLPFLKKGAIAQLVDVFHDFLMWFETLVFLITTVLFVLIDPIKHGLIVLLVFSVAFWQIRNYIFGKFVKVNNQFGVGVKIRVKDITGYIYKMGVTGIYIKQQEGIQYVPYYTVLTQGYSIMSGNLLGSLVRFNIRDENGEISNAEYQRIADMCLLSPYLEKDKPHNFELLNDGSINCVLQLKHDSLQSALVKLIEENKFEVTTLES